MKFNHGVKLPNTSPYTIKDQAKADACTKFIGRGSHPSSTRKYAEAFGRLANCRQYTEADRVFISVEGNRSARLTFDHHEVNLACTANVNFLTDDITNRSRPYNIGEREIAAYLTSKGYCECKDESGYWSRKVAQCLTQ